MNYYYVSYESIQGNLTNNVAPPLYGRLLIKADDLAQAKDKFFDWLKEQSFYAGLGRLFFSVEEVTDPILS